MAVKKTRLGNYEIIEEVGVGGLGKVYRGVDLRTGRYVAIKMLHDRFTRSKKFLGIFHRELLIVSRLHHKNIVEYLDGCFDLPHCYIVTEFVEGYSLYALMKKVNRLPPLVALCILIDMLQGIDYLHLHETIHSDLSAPNVLINVHGRVLVTDFGLACELEVEDYKNYMVGTPGYYSPEHITDRPIVPQTDLYCAGLLLYEMICGKKAVPATHDRRKALMDMKNIDFKNIPIIDWKMRHSVKKILKKALQVNVNKRIPNTETMMFAVYSILKKHGIRYTRHAIHQYLVDQELSRVKFNAQPQNIYHGFEPII